MSLPLTRDESINLLKSHTKTPSLFKHAYCVEAAMKYFAELLGYDPNYWATVGLLHDIDFDEHPDEHCKFAPQILKEAGFDDSFINSVLSHAYGHCTDIVPTHQMEKVIYTVDELTGLITASALMRPDKNIANIEVKSVKKKFKQASFAAAIDRELIKNGCQMLDMELDYVIEQCIKALQTIADIIELDGRLA